MTSELLKLQTIFTKALNEIFADFDHSKTDEILDNRDFTSFADLWTNAYNEIKQDAIKQVDKEKTDDIRKEIFRMTFSKTYSSDLSAYISEDFELISSYLLTNVTNKWATSLCATYFDNKIPQGELKNIDKTLKELINTQS